MYKLKDLKLVTFKDDKEKYVLLNQIEDILKCLPFPSLKILRSVVCNINNNPSNPKFRKIKVTNKILGARILKLPHARAILTTCGFRERGEFFVLDNNVDLGNLQNVATQSTAIYKMRAKKEEKKEKKKAPKKVKKEEKKK